MSQLSRLLKTPGGKFVGGFIANAAFSIGLSLLGDLLKPRKKPGIPPVDLGRNYGEPLAPVPVVYGRARVGVSRVFTETTDGHAYLWMVAAVAHGPVFRIEKVYLDGNEAVTFVDTAGALYNASRAVDGATDDKKYIGYAHAWAAHGTDGQNCVSPGERTAATVTGSENYPSTGTVSGVRLITTSSAHGFAAGDVVVGTGVAGLTAAKGYAVATVPTSTTLRITGGNEAFPANTGSSGSLAYYTPSLPTLFPTKWTAPHKGKGVAYIVLRLLLSDRFPNGVPRVEVLLKGTAVKDPRAVVTKTIASGASGAAQTGYANTANLTTTAAHGFAEGDIVLLANTGVAALNGFQRVDRVSSSTVFRVFAEWSGAVTGGTAEKRGYSSNPAVNIRDYLTNTRYGAAIPEASIDDTALGVEATHHDETVYVPIPNTATFAATRAITSAANSGGNTRVLTSGNHTYATGQSVLIAGHSVGGLNARFTLTVVDATHFDVPGNFGGGVLGTAQVQETQARYACDGAVDVTKPLKSNLEDLLSSCRGALVFQGGLWRPFTKKVTAASTTTITGDTSIGQWRATLPGTDGIANVVRAEFPNALRGYVQDAVEFPPPGWTNAYVSADGGLTVRKTIDLPFTSNPAAAKRICMTTRKESRAGIRVGVTMPEAGLALSVGDVVSVTKASPGWTAKGFWVEQLELLPTGEVQVALSEYSASAYSEDAFDDTPYAPTTDLPNPGTVVAPTGLQVAGDVRASRLVVTWAAAADRYVTLYQVQFKRSSDDDWTDAATVQAVEAAVTYRTEIAVALVNTAYDVRVRAVNGIGRVSAWLTVTGASVQIAPAPTVGTLTGESTADGGAATGRIHIPLTFDANTDQFLIYVADNGASGGLAPLQTTATLKQLVRRHEGATASADTFATQAEVELTASNWGKAIIVPTGPTGLTGDPVVREVQALDSGTAPTGPPSGLGVVYTGGDAAVSWTNGDAAASTLVWRNGIILKIAAPAATSFNDTDATPGGNYTWVVQHLRNGQTSAKVSIVGAAGSETLAAPTWDTGFPDGGTDLDSTAWVAFQFTNPDLLATTEIYKNDQSTDGGSWALLYTAAAGVGSYVDRAGVETTGTTRWFKLKAVRAGYTSSADSAHDDAIYGVSG